MITVELPGSYVMAEAKLSFIAVVGGYVESKREAELIAMQWAVRDMVNIRQQRIVFESSCVLARDTFLYLPSHVEHTPRVNDIHYILLSL